MTTEETNLETEREHRHESYGMVQVTRVTSSRGLYLFGSPVPDHHQIFRLRVAKGYAIEDDHGVMRYRASGTIVEVDLSAAQFVEMITVHGTNDGIPCTIQRLGGAVVADPPRPDTDVERSHAAFEEKMLAFGHKLDAYAAEVEKTVGGLPKAKREAILRATGRISMEVKSNIPFFLRTFAEAAERVVSTKKAEVEAWLSAVVHAAGLDHLRRLAPGAPSAESPVLAAHEIVEDAS